jgi:hypothetical protein
MPQWTRRGCLSLNRAAPRPRRAAAAGQVLNKDVGGRDQALQHLPRPLLFQVERHGLLEAVEPDEVARHPLDGLVVVTGKVSGPGALYLHDARAEVGELAGGEGGGDSLLQGDDRDPL